MAFPRIMTRLIEELNDMPGIGARSAQKLAFYMLRSPAGKINSLLNCIREVRQKIRFCGECNNLSESEACAICADGRRDRSSICVVGSPSAVMAMEKSGTYKGLYHVLLGELSPIDGIGPDQLKIKELVDRVRKGGTEEIIIATDFTTEGETTALYLFKILKPFKVKISRLAHGMPVGGSIEYADAATLQRALEERAAA